MMASSLGEAWDSSRVLAVIKMPLTQYPHWMACSCSKARYKDCITGSSCSPSKVVMDLSWQDHSGVSHEATERPFTST